MVHPLISNGRGTVTQVIVSKRVVHASLHDVHSSWAVRGSDGWVNNNNKFNTNNQVRAVVALDIEEKEGWIDAYFDCIRNKLSAKQCNEYRIDYEEDLWKLVWEVHSRTYRPSEAFCFIVTRPKRREIFAAAFRDRIVQHWIMLRLEPLIERRFRLQGEFSFNSRKGYGCLRAIQVARMHIERISERYTKEAWVAKVDISGFFMSIDKDVMLERLLPFIRSEYQGKDIDTLLWLTEVTIRHLPQEQCERRSPLSMWNDLPANKSLFSMPPNKGLPIGNITSQQLSNFYLSFFDEFLDEQCRYNNAAFVRFVDDVLIVASDKRFIVELRAKAQQWLKKHLKLRLHPDKFYLQEARKGVAFVGSVLKPGRTYTSNRTMGNMAVCVRTADRLCRRIVEEGATLESLRELRHLVQSLNSYMGYCVHNYTYNRRKEIFSGANYFWKCCNIQQRFSVVKVKKKYNYESFLIKTDQLQHEAEISNLAPIGKRKKRRGAEHLHRGVRRH